MPRRTTNKRLEQQATEAPVYEHLAEMYQLHDDVFAFYYQMRKGLHHKDWVKVMQMADKLVVRIDKIHVYAGLCKDAEG